MRIARLYLISFIILSVIVCITFYIKWGIHFSSKAFIGLYFLNVILWYISAEITDKYKRKFSTGSIRYLLAPYIKSALIQIIILLIFVTVININSEMYSIAAADITLFYIIEIITVLLIKLNINERLAENSEFNSDVLEVKEYPEAPGTVTVKLISLVNKTGNPEERLLSELFGEIQLSSAGALQNISQGEVRSASTKGVLFLKIIEKEFNTGRNIADELVNAHSLIEPRGYLFIKYNQKSISKAEMWGRLHYCGFEVISEKDIDGVFLVLSQKIREISTQRRSFKSFLIKLPRVGYEGRIFYAYKLRSMYPYSEFIQKKIYEMNSLDNTGKFNHDFRITPLGRILRKYWLDEIPQILNWLKSDVKLVGIRGMSRHYFNLYPEQYKKLFIKVKPGLIPPIFDETNQDFDSIQESEYKYLQSYTVSPFATDLKYFVKTFSNILLKGYRGR